MAAAYSTLDALIESFAARGNQPAIVAFDRDGGATENYADLHAAIRRVARGLAHLGLAPGETVLLWAPSDAAWIIAYFGIVAAGGTAIPLDDQTPMQRAAAVLKHSPARLAMTTRAHADALEKSDGTTAPTCVLLDGDPGGTRHWLNLDGPELDRPAPDPKRIASLLYTSGTTGTPKAVPLTHGNLAANVSALLGAELIGADDIVLVPLPFHHVYPFTVGLLTVLATGARVVLPAGISGPEITRAASESQATALIAVPRLCAAIWEGIERGVRSRGSGAWRTFSWLLALSTWIRRSTGIVVGRRLFRALHARVGPCLKTIGCGGAQLDRELGRKLEGLGFTVLTGYGLTETSPVLTFNRHAHHKLGTEGMPLPGVEIATLEHPEYAHGEIIARGPSVFAGYWQNPEETRNAFTADGWFKTGDLGWIDKGGFLHIAGRSKEVIVLPDGKNVFPDEIEDEFATSTLIAEIAVLAENDRLHALIVLDDDAVRERGAHRVEELLREEIAEVGLRLPRYQRLSDYRLTRTPLPRTPLGKLRRHLLHEAYANAATRQAAPAPATLSAEDNALLEGERPGAVWRWLEARYPEQALALDMSPQLDLGIDSLAWVTLTLELEREFHLTLDGEAVSRIVTLRDFLREVERAPAAARRDAVRVAATGPGAWLRVLGALLFAFNRLLVRMLLRLEIVGRDSLPAPDASFLIAPNHVSYLDPLVVAAALGRKHLANVYWAGWVGKMYAGPISRLVSRATRVFPVEPDRDPSGALALGRSVLEQRKILVWFPEGRRSYDGQLQRFQAGVGLLLADSNACAVPTAILGAYEVWPRDQRYPRRGTVKVVFGAPLSRAELVASGRGANDAERIADALQDAVAALQREHA